MSQFNGLQTMSENASILNRARSQNIDWSRGDVTLLNDDIELSLIRTMFRLPELVEHMARTLEPHHLPHYAGELARAIHMLHDQFSVLSSRPEDGEITSARLKLVESAQIVLRRTMELMGISAPERT